MNWTRQVDGYCERIGPEYWAEPLNALSNLAFIAVALWMWRRSAGHPQARVLCAVMVAIGVGSWLFHTHAQVWAGIADVLPIGLFVLLYLHAFNRGVLDLAPVSSLCLVAVALVLSSVSVANIGWLMALLGSSGPYASVLALILGYSALMLARDVRTARHLLAAGLLFAVSLTFRTLDTHLCDRFPAGTHFVWHLLNAWLLGWMITLYSRARLGKAQAAR